ncbi:MAG: hypothetical protein ABR501_14150 [Pyrinomonadaceae bacterium]
MGWILGKLIEVDLLVAIKDLKRREKWRGSLPTWMAFITDVNVSGLLSFILAFSGMVVGSLLTQKAYPPIELRPEETT